MEKYEWGGGCNGDKSKPHCPENLSQTVINARKMWQAVARALKTTDEAAPRFVHSDWNSVGKKPPLAKGVSPIRSGTRPSQSGHVRRPHWPHEDQVVRVSIVCCMCCMCCVLCFAWCVVCVCDNPAVLTFCVFNPTDEFVLNDANGLLTGTQGFATVAIGAAAVESGVHVHASIANVKDWKSSKQGGR